MYRMTGWVLILLTLFSCAARTPDVPDETAFEDILARNFGASGAAFSPNSRQVAVGTGEMIWVTDTTTQETIASLSYLRAAKFGSSKYWRAAKFGNSKSLQFIDDRRLVIGAEGVILIWDVMEDLVTDQLSLPKKDFVPRALAWSDARQMLAFSARTGTGPVKLVHIDERGFGPIRNFSGFEGIPSDLQFSRDGRYLAATGDGEGVFIREVETGQAVGELPTNGWVSDLELFGENQLLVAGTNIAFWTFLDDEEALGIDNPDLQGQITGQVVTRVAGTIALGALTLFAAMLAGFGGDASGVGGLAEATIDVATLPVKTSQQPWCGRSTSISPDGRWLADVYPGITKEVIQVYDLESQQTSKSLNPKGQYSCAVRFSPNGKQLLITTDKVARLYNTETWGHRDLKLDKSR